MKPRAVLIYACLFQATFTDSRCSFASAFSLNVGGPERTCAQCNTNYQAQVTRSQCWRRSNRRTLGTIVYRREGAVRLFSSSNDEDAGNEDDRKEEPDVNDVQPESVTRGTESPQEKRAADIRAARARLTAYAGTLDTSGWLPPNQKEEKEPELSVEAQQEKMEDDWLAKKLQVALFKNRNIEAGADRMIMSQWLEEGQEEMRREGEKIKEEYTREAQRIKDQVMEEFEVSKRVMDINISNIIARGRANYTRATGSLSDTTPFPSSSADSFANLSEDEETFYEDLGVAPPPEDTRANLMTEEERDQLEAELKALSPEDIVKAATSQVEARAKSNATAEAAALRREMESAGEVVVVGSDGNVGARTLALFAREAELDGRGAARVRSADGISLEDTRKMLIVGSSASEKLRSARSLLQRVKTLVLAPVDAGPQDAKAGGGVGGLGGLFGDKEKIEAGDLSDVEAAELVEACGDGLKHVICLSAGIPSRGGFFGGGGDEDKTFPAGSKAEEGIVRKAKARGVSYSAVRVTTLANERRAAPKPLITVKNVPRAGGAKGSKPQESSRDIAAETLLRMSYQPESRRNSTFAVSDFPETSWPVPAGGWADEFVKLTGPELYRVTIPEKIANGGSGTFKAWAFLREWAALWKESGTGLTTPVKVFVDESTRRIGLHFDPSVKNYQSAKEEKEAEERREARAKDKGSSGPRRKDQGVLTKEGGVDIVVEDKPYTRVRAIRANMGPKTVVKEMSEKLILDRLKKDLKIIREQESGP